MRKRRGRGEGSETTEAPSLPLSDNSHSHFVHCLLARSRNLLLLLQLSLQYRSEPMLSNPPIASMKTEMVMTTPSHFLHHVVFHFMLKLDYIIPNPVRAPQRPIILCRVLGGPRRPDTWRKQSIFDPKRSSKNCRSAGSRRPFPITILWSLRKYSKQLSLNCLRVFFLRAFVLRSVRMRSL